MTSTGTAANGDGPIGRGWVVACRWIRKSFESFLTTLPTGAGNLKAREDMGVRKEVRHSREGSDRFSRDGVAIGALQTVVSKLEGRYG
jgi:hypothetical protein